MTPFKVVATVLYGANDDEIVVDAIRSVYDVVDHVLVIDTADRSPDVNSEILGCFAGASRKLIATKFKWTSNASDARNFALDEATKHGDWAMTLDTDERVELGSKAHLQLELCAAHDMGACVVYVRQQDQSYVKERFIRLPSPIDWVGPTHEAYRPGHLPTYTATGMSFTELPRTLEQYKARCARDRVRLEAYLVEHADEPRWWYYLGESFFGLGDYRNAASAYQRCAALRGWDEESAWACYKTAECYMLLGEAEEALESCALGLARHAGVAELAWLAGRICWQLGRNEQAVYWSKLAVVHGCFLGDGREIPRIGFKHVPGLWEGPYDVMHWAEKALGHIGLAQGYEAMTTAAKAARNQGTSE